MKKLINQKTGEIAYLNLENNTIRFSKTKGTFKAYIEKDPENNKIVKITASPKPFSTTLFNEPIEINNEQIPEVTEDEEINEKEKNISSMYPRLKLSPNEFINLYIETAVKDIDSIESQHIPIRPTNKSEKVYRNH